MNRRKFLQIASTSVIASSFVTVHSPTPIVPVVQPKWFTQKQLLRLMEKSQYIGTQEKLNLSNPKQELLMPAHSNELMLQNHHRFYFSTARLSNCIYRKTLDNISDRWMVLSPKTCEREDLWPEYLFQDYDIENKQKIKRHWKDRIIEEVTPNIFRLPAMNCKWHMYICKDFPENQVLFGLGFKEVRRYKEYTGNSMAEYDAGCYMGLPTWKHYALCTLV